MRIALTADRFMGIPPGSILYLIYWLGVEGAEVTLKLLRQPFMSRRPSGRMQLGLHLPNIGSCVYDFSLAGSQSEIEEDLKLIEKNRNRFHFSYAVFHPPEGGPGTSFSSLMKNVEKTGIPLLLENVKPYSLQSFNSFYKKCLEVLDGRLAGICLDIPHAYLGGTDWRDWYAFFGSRIRVIHLSNCDEEDRHLPFGLEGHLRLQEILQELKKFGFDGTLNFEIKPPSLASLGKVFDTYLETMSFFGKPVEGKYRKRMERLDIGFRKAGNRLSRENPAGTV